MFETMIVNVAGQVRTEDLDGRECYVAPMVMITEGVHNGSMGPVLYEGDELTTFAPSWDSKPIVVNHPHDGKGFITAASPEVIKKKGVGIVLNTAFADSKLKAEAWLYKDKLKDLLPEVYNSFANKTGTKFEISTGLQVTHVTPGGTWNSKVYNTKATKHRPNHLAILTEGVGACSVADGGGLLANEGEDPAKMLAMMRAQQSNELVVNDQSFNDIRMQVYVLLRTKFEQPGYYWNGYVDDVFQGYFVYCVEAKCYKQAYTVTNDVVAFTGDPVEVVRVTQYRAVGDGSYVGNSFQPVTSNQERIFMDRAAKVTALIANKASGWEEADRAALMGYSEDKFTKITTNAAPAPAVPLPVVAPVIPAVVTPPAITTNATAVEVPKMPTLQDLINNSDPATQEQFAEMQAAWLKEKTHLVNKIKAAPGNVLTEAQLNGMTLNHLRPMAALIPDVVANPNMPMNVSVPLAVNQAVPTPNYAGINPPVVNSAGAAVAPPATLQRNSMHDYTNNKQATNGTPAAAK